MKRNNIFFGGAFPKVFLAAADLLFFNLAIVFAYFIVCFVFDNLFLFLRTK